MVGRKRGARVMVNWRQQLLTTRIVWEYGWGMLFELRESAIREKLRIRSRKRKYAKLKV